MDYMMITFQSGQCEPMDLKVPVFVSTEELLGMLADALSIQVDPANRLQAEPLGRILDNNRTLLEQGVKQGALLTLI